MRAASSKDKSTTLYSKLFPEFKVDPDIIARFKVEARNNVVEEAEEDEDRELYTPDEDF